MASMASPRGTGFNSLPSLAITSIVFEFLKSLKLKIAGRGLGDVLLVFGWELVLFKPYVEPTVSDGVSEPCVVQLGPEPVSE